MFRTGITLCVLALCSLATAQSIEITSVPPYGSNGVLTGTVSGVNFNTHSVATYIFIEGAGWWIKPGTTTVPIAANGTFSVNVTTGGVDHLASIFYVALIGPGQFAPPALGTGGLTPFAHVAEDILDRPARVIQFAGRSWGVKTSYTQVGPGPNWFSSSVNDVFVDAQGRLHLKVRWSNGAWRSSEVICLDSLGHGTYWFTTESEVEDLDPALVFGAFTWDSWGDDPSIPSWPWREIDFEDSRWLNPGDPTTSQVVVQPWNVAGNLFRFTVPDLAGAPTLTRYFRWEPASVTFMAALGRHTPCSVPPGSILHQSVYAHSPGINHIVPPAGRERFRFNLWQINGIAPSNGQEAEVIISDFRFSPDALAFPGGSSLNIAGGLTVASGSPTLGNSLTLDVDDPSGTVPTGAFALLLVSPLSDPAFPFGTVYPGIGFGGTDTELLVPASPAPLVLAGAAPWTGPGSPVPFTLNIPYVPPLVGFAFYTQGVLSQGGQVGLTNGWEFCIGL